MRALEPTAASIRNGTLPAVTANDREPTPPAASLAGRRDALLAWFDERARDLPWRRDRSPYRVWISEAMLQQTRAATVAPYFERWMERFPDVASLASAEIDEVLRMWEGLGYYRRAHALHAAARTVVHERDGRWPDDEADWRSLPGIGPYTAAAITALAQGRPTVAVDANVRRVGARLHAEASPDDRRLRTSLAVLLPDDRPGRATEALIELGATVCTPRTPACDGCPLEPACAGRKAGAPERFPAARERRRAPLRRRWAVVRIENGRVRLERRAPGLLGGLWGFPQRDTAPDGRALDALTQTYSHFELQLTPVLVRPGSQSPAAASEPPEAPESRLETDLFDAAAAAAVPLSRVDRRLLERLVADGLLAS